MNDHHRMFHAGTGRDSAELAALYLMGAMTPADEVQFERHLDAGCTECVREVRELTDVVTDLATALPPVSPNPDVRDKLMARIESANRIPAPVTPLAPHLEQAALPANTGVLGAALITVKAGNELWEPTAVPGVGIRVLFVDKERDQFMALVRMAAGTSYPRHTHGGAEHCLVLEGDLCVGDETLHAGDYQLAPAGSRHPVQTTRNGCLLYITSSLHDEFEG